MITLGRIAGIYGTRGWLRVESWTRPVENLLQYHQWHLSLPELPMVEVLEGRAHGPGLVASIAGLDGQRIEDRDQAASLVGALIQIEREALPAAPAGSYYWADLIGLEVRNVQGEFLGRVETLMDNGAQDVMVVVDEKHRRLIPFVAGAVVHDVDLDAAALTVDWAADY